MNTTTLRYVTHQEVLALLSLPGAIHIRINKMDGYFVPFVFHTAPAEKPIGHGPIMQDNALVASLDLDPLVEELRTALGSVKIYAPIAPGPDRVLH